MLVPFSSLFFSISHTWIHSNPKIEIKQDSILDKIIMTIFVFHLLCIFIEINFSGGNCSNMLSFQVENQQNHLKLTAIILKKIVLSVRRIELRFRCTIWNPLNDWFSTQTIKEALCISVWKTILTFGMYCGQHLVPISLLSKIATVLYSIQIYGCDGDRFAII